MREGGMDKPVLPLTIHGAWDKLITLSSVKTPAFCCGQTELPAASSGCQSVPSPNSGHFFGLEGREAGWLYLLMNYPNTR